MVESLAGGIEIQAGPCVCCGGSGSDPFYADPYPCPCCRGAGELTSEWVQTGPHTLEYRERDPQGELFGGET